MDVVVEGDGDGDSVVLVLVDMSVEAVTVAVPVDAPDVVVVEAVVAAGAEEGDTAADVEVVADTGVAEDV